MQAPPADSVARAMIMAVMSTTMRLFPTLADIAIIGGPMAPGINIGMAPAGSIIAAAPTATLRLAKSQSGSRTAGEIPTANGFGRM